MDRAVPFKANSWKVCLAILLVGTILLGQGNDPRFQAEATAYSELTMETYAGMGRVIVFGSGPLVPGKKSIGKGQCPLCHTFDPGDNIGRCPNLFGVEQRSRTRIKESRYLNEPIKIGETDPASGIVKGKPDQIPEEFRRYFSMELTGEDYLRESMLCPSCYVVKGYGKAGDTISTMPMAHKSPIGLGRIELNAVIAWLQVKDTPGDLSFITIPMPGSEQDLPVDEYLSEKKRVEDHRTLVTCDQSACVEDMIHAMGCPLCHVVPGTSGGEGVGGRLGPKLHMKTNAPKRLKDPNYKGKARTAREYIKESILNPDAYIVFNEASGEPYPAGVMPQDYPSMISIKSLEVLVDFISNTQSEGK